jgi:hypothetical protein
MEGVKFTPSAYTYEAAVPTVAVVHKAEDTRAVVKPVPIL